MTPNYKPLFPIAPHLPFTILTDAYTGYDGAHANVKPIYVANAIEDIQVIRFRPLGTMSATTAKIFGNNGSSHLTGTNNFFVDEIELPSVTATPGVPMDKVDWFDRYIVLPEGNLFYACLSIARTPGWQVVSSGRVFGT